jgi:hypothetical protein
MNYEVSKHIVSASHVHNRGIVDSNLHHYCITSELMITSAEKRVGSETKMSFEEYAESIDVSPFAHGNETVVDIRLHSCLLEEAFRNGKALSSS